MTTSAPFDQETAVADGAAERISPRALFRMAEFRHLLWTRFPAQWGDGVFQAGLAGAVLFNPQRAADALTIAGGFAVLLLPYSLIAPFAGALLDRWDRRRVLIVANALRAIAILCCAGGVALGVNGIGLFTLALLVMAISRFAGAGLSAALPHVVPERSIVTANALATTLGAVIAVFGGGCAIGLRTLLGAGDTGSGATTAIAAVGSVTAALVALRIPRGLLGPTRVDEPADAVTAVARGLFDGARAALRCPGVRAGFVALLAHRAAFGIALLLTVLLMRFSFTDEGPFKAGLAGLGQVAVLGGAGIVLAGYLTPRLVERFGRRRAIVGSLLLAAVAQAGLGLPFLLPTVLIASFAVTSAGQVIKLCVDASVQRDIGDESRGRVFALYDTLFNVTQVLAVTVAALLAPPDGHAPALLVGAIVLYLLGAVGFVRASRRAGPAG
ncbi:Predicted arabinose efflux permease, MFS family [Amycolatopsis marina]|uniref:Predicted arabinose efflux permease, MFS family n=2 Tax=Amycolatopsis marina TaxID=490629 RepID=A0A1I0VXM0_9PSEU|nr:Predicted arabinose efflux permease, MFS family [Amycolatopsis marina]